MKILDFLVKKVPSFITATGAGVVIGNAATGYLTGQVSGREALYQGGLGVIAIGLRRALAKGQPAAQTPAVSQ